MHDPLEESRERYVKCALDEATVETVRRVILEALRQSYRPMFLSDFALALEKVGIGERKGGVLFIGRVAASRYVVKRVLELQAKGADIVKIQIENSKHHSYGLRKYEGEYVPLPRGASRTLDLLKRTWERLKTKEFTTSDVSFEVKINKRKFENQRMRKHANILVNAGLIEYDIPIIKLTDKCVKYFSRE